MKRGIAVPVLHSFLIYEPNEKISLSASVWLLGLDKRDLLVRGKPEILAKKAKQASTGRRKCTRTDRERRERLWSGMSLTFKYVGLRLIFSFSCRKNSQCIPLRKSRFLISESISPASERKEAHAIGREVSSSSKREEDKVARGREPHRRSPPGLTVISILAYPLLSERGVKMA